MTYYIQGWIYGSHCKRLLFCGGFILIESCKGARHPPNPAPSILLSHKGTYHMANDKTID